MAVFQRTENRNQNKTMATGFSFQQFETVLKMLDKKLKPGGLFIVDHTDFDFAETAIAEHYQPLAFAANKIVRQRPIYNKENKKQPPQLLSTGFI